MSFSFDEEEERRWDREAGVQRSAVVFDHVTPEERNWAVAAQLAGFAKYLIPFSNIAITFVIWLSKRDESRFIELHARESMNFQITMAIYWVVAIILSWVLIGYLLLVVLMAFDLVAVIMGALKASRGEPYRYPASLRLVS
jgi:uncharacterized Tic20 family protein